MIKIKIYNKATDKLIREEKAKDKKELREILTKKVNHETERAIPFTIKNLLVKL